jgi:glutathione S-transferase
MKLYAFPPSTRVVAVVAVMHHLGLEYELQNLDLGKGDHLTPEYRAMNPNNKMPMLEDEGFLLWESNAILFYLAAKAPQSGLWPSATKLQADVLRWLVWESAHWDAESCGMVAFEKTSKAVLGLGPPDPAFIARGEQNFGRFAAALNQSLEDRKWLTGDTLTIADFSVGAFVPSADRFQLPVKTFPQIMRWYEGLATLPAWQQALDEKNAAMATWQASSGR